MTDRETRPGARAEKRTRVRRAAAVWSNGATSTDSAGTGGTGSTAGTAGSEPTPAVTTTPAAPPAAPAAPPAAPSTPTTADKPGREPGTTGKQIKGAIDDVRSRVGSIVWIISVLCALVLAAAAVLVALGANPDNEVVLWVRVRAGELDGPFGDLFDIKGENAFKKNLLVNNGIAAVAYLVVGKVAERLIKP